MPSIFSRIIAGEIPCYKIAENEHCFAFLDIHPLKKGHTLVVPKKEVDYLFDLDDETYTQLQLFAKEVGLAVQKVIPCNRIGVIVVGLDVPHAHIHLVPMNRSSDLNITNTPLNVEQEEMKEIAEKIHKQWLTKA